MIDVICRVMQPGQGWTGGEDSVHARETYRPRFKAYGVDSEELPAWARQSKGWNNEPMIATVAFGDGREITWPHVSLQVPRLAMEKSSEDSDPELVAMLTLSSAEIRAETAAVLAQMALDACTVRLCIRPAQLAFGEDGVSGGLDIDAADAERNRPYADALVGRGAVVEGMGIVQAEPASDSAATTAEADPEEGDDPVDRSPVFGPGTTPPTEAEVAEATARVDARRAAAERRRERQARAEAAARIEAGTGGGDAA